MTVWARSPNLCPATDSQYEPVAISPSPTMPSITVQSSHSREPVLKPTKTNTTMTASNISNCHPTARSVSARCSRSSGSTCLRPACVMPHLVTQAASDHAGLVAQLLHQFLRDLTRRAFQQLRLFCLLRDIESPNLLKVGADRGLHVLHCHFLQWLVLGLLDSDQRRIAQLIDPGLDGKHRRQRHLHKLEKSGLQLAFHPDAVRRLLDLHDDGGVRPPQQLGQHHAGLRVSVVVRLQAGEDEVELLILDRRL